MCSWSFVHSSLCASKNKSLNLLHYFWFYDKFCKKNVLLFFLFFSFANKKGKEKYTLNSIMLQNEFELWTVMNFDFTFKFFLLQRKKMYILKFIFALNFLLLRHDICFQSFVSFHPIRRISIQWMWVARLMQFRGKFFLQSYRLEELINY